MKYPVGARVRVVDCNSGGNFEVGDIVRIDHIVEQSRKPHTQHARLCHLCLC